MTISVGDRFGSRTVTEPAGKAGGKTMWKMRCDCGNEKPVSATNLLTGRALRCGSCSGRRRTGAVTRARTGRRVPRTLLSHFRARARVAGYEFTLVEADIELLYDEQGGRCVLTGTPLHFARCSKTQPVSNLSIDRKNNGRGYTRDNVQLVTKAANLARGGLALGEFVALCQAVARHAAVQVAQATR